ncbi:hypothetical protein [Microcoleus sp. B7-D4]|uniref:hypothetical protein n=1 Tax=Microcoleus sp. B7-D4 TaxID=2818696 RepID=UPI002FD1ABE1
MLQTSIAISHSGSDAQQGFNIKSTKVCEVKVWNVLIVKAIFLLKMERLITGNSDFNVKIVVVSQIENSQYKQISLSLTQCVTEILCKRPQLVAFRLLKIGSEFPALPLLFKIDRYRDAGSYTTRVLSPLP